MNSSDERDGSDRKADRDLMVKAQQRWVLFLAVANASGLIAVGAKALEMLAEPIAYLLLPSCWAFAAGLLLAGALPFLGMWQGLITEQAWRAKNSEGKPANLILRESLNRLEGLFEILSSSAFAFGLIYPLTVVSVRYLETGMLT